MDRQDSTYKSNIFSSFEEMMQEAGETEELIKIIPIEGTPFSIVKIEEEMFGAISNAQVTEKVKYNKKNLKKIKEELTEISWNRITQLVSIMINESEKIKEVLNKEEK